MHLLLNGQKVVPNGNKVYGKTINRTLCYVWYVGDTMYAASIRSKKVIGKWALADLANTWPLQLK